MLRVAYQESENLEKQQGLSSLYYMFLPRSIGRPFLITLTKHVVRPLITSEENESSD
jgi:hypothetical protein